MQDANIINIRQNKYCVNDLVNYNGSLYKVTACYLFGNFYTYDLKEKEFGSEFYGVWEEDITERK